MKKIQILKSRSVAVGALLLASASLALAQTADLTVNPFSSGNNSEGSTPNGCSVLWGDGTILWDNSQLYPGTTGSAYVQAGFSTTDGTGSPVQDDICFSYDNWYYINPNNTPQTVDLSQYSAIQFEIMWDTNFSTMSIDQFNNPALYQASLSGSTPGLGVGWVVPYGNLPFLTYTNIPDAASNGWVTVTIPIPDNLSGTAGTVGIFFTKYINNESTLTTIPAANFWVANVQFLGTAGPPPPPTVLTPTKPVRGLNVFNSTDGNTYYDRQQVALVASNGVSWVGTASSANPVTYSFTIKSFPPSPANATEAYLMLSPNPAAYDNALDYNEPNCVVMDVQSTATGSLMTFGFKTNEPASETYTTVATVNSAQSPVGKWSVTFTSPTNVTVTGSDGAQTSFIFTNGVNFAETQSPGCYLYLGGQANAASALNNALVYSSFSITGTPAAISDNFLADPTLNTNVWFNFVATGPHGVFVMPSGAENWVSWTLPAAGFQLQDATNLTGPWTVPSGDFILSEVGQVSQLITTNDLPAGTPNAFFELASP